MKFKGKISLIDNSNKEECCKHMEEYEYDNEDVNKDEEIEG